METKEGHVMQRNDKDINIFLNTILDNLYEDWRHFNSHI